MSFQNSYKVWSGVYGDHVIPDHIYSLVKRWRKDGWPHKQDKGKEEFLAWVYMKEEEDIASNGVV